MKGKGLSRRIYMLLTSIDLTLHHRHSLPEKEKEKERQEEEEEEEEEKDYSTSTRLPTPGNTPATTPR